MEKMEQNDYKEYEDYLEMKIQKDKEDKEKNNFNKKCKKIIFSPIFINNRNIIIISIIILIIKITNVSSYFHCKLKYDKIYHCENYWKNNVYEGEFKNGKRHGKGIYFSENEFFYIGNWKEDIIEGEGIFIKNNSEAYIGKFENGEIIEGNYTHSNIYKKKDILSTEFFDEIYNGILNEINCNKDVVPSECYKGPFKDWKFNGKGCEYKNGDLYEGDFKDNKYNGYGKMIYKNGDEYDGQWKNGKKHGEGTMIIYQPYWFNTKQHCIWVNDVCIKEIK